MPKLAAPLTVASIKAFASSPKRPVEIRDGGCRGLILRLERSGLLVWYKVGKSEAPKGSRVRLGEYPGITLGMARSKVVVEVPKAATTVQDAIDAYKVWLQAHKTPQQVIGNLWHLSQVVWGDVLSKEVSQLSPQVMDGWLGSRLQEVGKTTAKRDLNSLRACLQRALEAGMIPSNPLSGYTIKAPNVRRTRILSSEEKSRLVDAAKDAGPVGALAMLCLFAGLRLGEALKLRWEDLDLANDLIHVRGATSKTAMGRTIPLHPVARASLERLQHRSGPIFVGRGVEYLTSPKKAWEKIRKAAGLGSEVGFYTLRHSAASALLEQGADIETVRCILGHADVSTTSIYLHSTALRLREAIGKL